MLFFKSDEVRRQNNQKPQNNNWNHNNDKQPYKDDNRGPHR